MHKRLLVLFVMLLLTTAQTNGPKRSARRGVSLSPRSFDEADFVLFFEQATQMGQVISWGGDWDELGEEGAPMVIAELARVYDYLPMVQATFFSQDSGALLRPLDVATRQRYRNSAVTFAETYQPPYLALGIEVNVLWDKSPDDFDDFAVFFAEVYAAVKAVSPQTQVFPTFQLEKLKGLSGGLFGGENDPAQAQWDLLDRFPNADMIAFTTYPGLVYANPADIPDDYFAEIRAHTEKPVAFSEIGWHTAETIAGWESSEDEQAAFVERFFALIEPVSPALILWSFLYDQSQLAPFDSMGLRREDGTPRPAWDVWMAQTQ